MEATSGTRDRNRDGDSGRLQPQLPRTARNFFFGGGRTGSLERGSGECGVGPGSEKGRTKLLYTFPRVFGLSLAVWETDMGWKQRLAAGLCRASAGNESGLLCSRAVCEGAGRRFSLYNLGKAGRVLVSGVGGGLALDFYMDFAPSSEYNRDESRMAQIGRLGIK